MRVFITHVLNVYVYTQMHNEHQLVLINANAVQARFVPRKVPFDDDVDLKCILQISNAIAVDLKCILQTANAIAQTHMVLSPEAAARYGAPEEWGRGKLYANNKN